MENKIQKKPQDHIIHLNIHCGIPLKKNYNTLDRIFPNQITRKETIKEMFGNVQKPPRYKINTNNNNVGLSKTTAGKSSFGRGGSNIIRSTI